MGTEKLTAKLSDGREFEVCSTWHAKEDNYVMIVCRPPQEKQAREWWDVRFKETGNAYTTCETEAEARETAAYPDNLFEVVHVREVLG